MPNSLIVPISKIPGDLSELQGSVASEFLRANKALPKIWYKTIKSNTHDLLDGFVEIQGDFEKESCLLDFSFIEESARERDEKDLAYFAAISARGSRGFLILIACGLKRFGARVLYDDAHFLGKLDRFDLENLKNQGDF